MLNWFFKWGVESPLSLSHEKREKKLFSYIGNSFGGIHIWLSPKGREIICLKWFFSLTSEISENSIILVICYCIKKVSWSFKQQTFISRHFCGSGIWVGLSWLPLPWFLSCGCLQSGFPLNKQVREQERMSKTETESFCNLKLELTSQKPVITRSSLHSKGKDYTRAGTIQEVMIVGCHFRNCLPHLLTTFSDLIPLIHQQA